MILERNLCVFSWKHLYVLSPKYLTRKRLNRLRPDFLRIPSIRSFCIDYNNDAPKIGSYSQDFSSISPRNPNQPTAPNVFVAKNSTVEKTELWKSRAHFQNVYFILKRNQEVPLNALVYLPKTAYATNRERDFIDDLLILWWRQLKPKLNSERVYCSDIIKGTLYGLKKVDATLRGNLSNRFPWLELDFLIDYVLRSILDVSPKNFNHFLNCINSLLKSYALNRDEVGEFRRKIVDSLDTYVDSLLDDESNIRFSQHIRFHICQIVFKFKVNVDSTSNLLSEGCTRKLIAMYSQILDDRFSSTFIYLQNLHFMADVFLSWNLDPNSYNRNFWKIWFANMYKSYATLQTSHGLFNAFFLMDCIKVALKFDQELEFLKGLPLWLNGIRSNNRFILDENLCVVVEEIHKKYLDCKYVGIVDELTVNNILTCLRKNG